MAFKIQRLYQTSKSGLQFTRSILPYAFKAIGHGNVNQRTISSCQENPSLVLHGIGDLRIENRQVPKYKPNQVLIQMESVGICGSDVHYYEHGSIGPFVVKEPMVIGHEASGTIVECGSEVENLKPGDKVAIEPQIPCRKCEYCKTGRYNLCTGLFFCATPPDDGNLCRYYAHDADFCFKLPPNMDLDEGALMEPLSVGVHCCERAQVTCGDTVLILGAGPIGLVTLLASKAMGASKIFVTDIDDTKVQMAAKLGATNGLNVQGMEEKDVVYKIITELGHKPNKTIDCCGIQSAIRTGIFATKSGGKMILAGMAEPQICFPTVEVCTREVAVLGVFRYVNNYPIAIDMVSSGKINVKPLITHHFKFEDAIKAFELAKSKKDYIKILIHPNPDWKPSNIC